MQLLCTCTSSSLDNLACSSSSITERVYWIAAAGSCSSVVRAPTAKVEALDSTHWLPSRAAPIRRAS